MAAGQKLLIDTNVLIGLEDWRETSPSFAKLQKLCSQHGHRVFVHDAAVSDIMRDTDIQRRRVTLSKVEKFERLSGIKTPQASVLAATYGKISGPNDHVDVQLLYALELGAVDFLVTEDQGIHARARRISTDCADRVLTVVEAVQWLVSEHEPKAVHLPLIEDVPAHAVPLNDPLFDSLRDGYPDFDRWWREKCVAEHRPCWVATIGNLMAGIIVRKDELEESAGSKRKVLKLCTFKVKPEFRGEKLGELLLKQALWFGQQNGYDSVYLTTFPEQVVLIGVLEYYGFERSGPDQNGELRLEKRLTSAKLIPHAGEDLYELARKNYPRFVSAPLAKAFCIPIRGEYHDMLFPELADRKQTDLFEAMGLESARPRTPGNTIRKIYLCKAQTNQVTPGSIVLFYRSSSTPSPLSQSVTTLGLVERVSQPDNYESLVRLTAKRSVYSPNQLANMIEGGRRPIKAIDFLLVGHLEKPISLPELNRLGIFSGHPPQSISRLSAERFEPIKAFVDFGFDL